MIYVRDKGRMCNNILQYGHLYAWGREHGKLTVSMRFAYKYPYFKISSMPGHNFFRYVFAKYAAKLGLMPVVSFDVEGEDTSAKEKVMMESGNVVAQGWHARFYTEFLKYFDDIKELFAFKPEIVNKISGFIERNSIPGSVRLGVHIRRGDYARWQNGKYFYSDAQYIGQIKKFHDFIGENVTVFLSTNDSSLDPAKFQDSFPEDAVKIVLAGGNEAEDLCLLSQCGWLIGPPSTYTLVASMYNDIPLYWVKNPQEKISADRFGHFRELFKQII